MRSSPSRLPLALRSALAPTLRSAPPRGGRTARVSAIAIGAVFAAAVAGVVTGAGPLPARADTARAWCLESRKADDAPMSDVRRCTFSQRQGNVNVRVEDRDYAFPAASDGQAYRRSAEPDGLRFETDALVLRVWWQDPQPYAGSPRCSMNRGLWRRCSVGPLAGVPDGLEVRFAGSYDAPEFRFRPVPGSTPTTDNRPMLDGQGNRWLYSGHRSFTLIEQGGFRNRLDVAVD